MASFICGAGRREAGKADKQAAIPAVRFWKIEQVLGLGAVVNGEIKGE